MGQAVPGCADLDLEVTAPNGTKYASSTVSSHVELVSFVPPVSGTYTVTVKRYSSPASEPNVHFAIAFY